MKPPARQPEIECFDALVIGAGPAGSAAALQLARRGRRVLLVDRARFPRHKVCGGCVNPAAIDVLTSLGLGDRLNRLHARPTRALRLCTGRTSSTIALSGGVAISRQAFDQALVDEAIAAGVTFRDGCSATLQPDTSGHIRSVLLLHDQHTTTVHANIILACAGLDARLLEGERDLPLKIARRSHMGVSAIATDVNAAYEPGVIHMVHGKGGYVGLVRIETGALDIAAALSPAFVKKQGGPAGAVEAILRSAHQPAIDSLHALDWQGTPLLSRRRTRVASHRLFVLGDAAGYVEPFTGEGIAWALASAQACAPIADAAIDAWSDAHAAAWNQTHHRLLAARQRRCRWLTRALRWRPLVGLANRVLRWAPALARPLVRSIQASWQSVAPPEPSLIKGEAR